MTDYQLSQMPDKLQIIPLGGSMEIGKNMYAYCCNNQILVVDAGLKFPEEDMPGVDIVIPDFSFLEEHADIIHGIVLTHGHEDHIGALPYVLKSLKVPVWGTALTLGFLGNKLEERGMMSSVELNTVKAGETLELGDFTIEFVRVSHSIPDAVGLLIRTPAGIVFHSGDFKFDQSPVAGYAIDVAHLAKVGNEGVLALMCDVTNVERPGYTPSERLVGESFDRIFSQAEGRIIIAAFASNIHRVQQVINTAAKYGRKVLITGRSMENNCRIAEQLGYLKIPTDTHMNKSDLDKTPAWETVIMTTGSQGEPLSALSKMSIDEHKQIKLGEGDTVIISATPIPGNESLVLKTVNRLFKRGAYVIYESSENVHVSGHGYQEDIKMLVNFLKPQYLIPVHGEARHFKRFVQLMETMHYPKESIFGLHPGDILEFDKYDAHLAGHVKAGSILVDGLGVGDVEGEVLRDRRNLANDGVVILVLGLDAETGNFVTGPDIFSRGFAGEEIGGELVEEAKQRLIEKLNELLNNNESEDPEEIKTVSKRTLAKFIYEKTHRRPVIVPILMDI